MVNPNNIVNVKICEDVYHSFTQKLQNGFG